MCTKLKGFSVNAGLVFITAVIFIGILSQALFAQQPRDLVRLKKNSEEFKGSIIKETFKGLTIQITNGTREFGWNEIDEVQYDKTPSLWYQGEKEELDGKYPQAAATYQKLSEKTDTRDIFKQHVMYKLALNLQLSGNLKEAAAKYDQLLTAVPDTKYFREAGLDWIKCYPDRTKTVEALTTLEKVSTLADKSGLNDEFKFKLKLLKAQILTPSDPQTAKQVYVQIKQQAGNLPEIKAIATVGEGLIMIKEKQYPQAEQLLKGVLGESANPTALAGVYYGLGEVCFQRGETSNSSTDYKDALLHYLKVNILYYPAPGDDIAVDYYLAATFQAGRCFKKMLKFVDAGKQSEYNDMANALFQEIIKNFSYHPLAPKAKEEMSK
jgi:tetratricopeptide (TPR) repeat protein